MFNKPVPECRQTVARFMDLHSTQAAQLSAMMEGSGLVAGLSRFSGGVRLALVSGRTMFEVVDIEVLGKINLCENSVLTAFDDVLDAGLPAADFDMIEAMRVELARLLDDTRPKVHAATLMKPCLSGRKLK